MRALRVDKMTLAALETTLGLIRDGANDAGGVPLWKMLSIPLPQLEARARRLVDVLRDELGLNASVVTVRVVHRAEGACRCSPFRQWP